MNSQISSAQFVAYGSIIIPKDKSSNGFNRTVYLPAMTEEKITSGEVNQVLSDLELVTKKLPTACGNLMTLIHLFVLPLIAMIFLTNEWYCEYYDYRSESYRNRYYWDRSWMPFFIYCLIVFVYLKFNKKYQLMKIRAEAETIFQMHQPQFNKKGYRLFVPFNFPQWIEIQRDSYPQQMPVPNNNLFNVPQSFSQVLQSSPVKKMREYGASALQSLASKIQNNPNSQNSQDYQPPLQSEQVNQC